MIRIKNWKKFQHYNTRRPIWIKLYKDLLDDPDWYQLDSNLLRHLVNMWLIASDDIGMEGTLPESKKLAFRLRVSVEELEKSIIPGLSGWLIIDDSKVIADGYQVAMPEKEKEKEKTIEQTRSHSPKNGSGRKSGRTKKDYTPDFTEFWNAYPRRIGKLVAFKKYLTVTKDPRYPPADLKSSAEEYADQCRKEKREEKYILHPATFLEKDRWKDYCLIVVPQTQSEGSEQCP